MVVGSLLSYSPIGKVTFQGLCLFELRLLGVYCMTIYLKGGPRTGRHQWRHITPINGRNSICSWGSYPYNWSYTWVTGVISPRTKWSYFTLLTNWFFLGADLVVLKNIWLLKEAIFKRNQHLDIVPTNGKPTWMSQEVSQCLVSGFWFFHLLINGVYLRDCSNECVSGGQSVNLLSPILACAFFCCRHLLHTDALILDGFKGPLLLFFQVCHVGREPGFPARCSDSSLQPPCPPAGRSLPWLQQPAQGLLIRHPYRP